jgi:hypothetical protein
VTADFPSEISDWAEHLGTALAGARIDGSPMHEQAGILQAATIEPAIAYQVLITLSRTVALVLRPTGHAGGPIGMRPALAFDPAFVRAAQLVGFAAQGDAGMVDALARAVLAAPGDALLEARTTLWAILEVLATEPVTPTETKDRP